MRAPAPIRHAADKDLLRLERAGLNAFVVALDVELRTDEGKSISSAGTGLIIRSPRGREPGLILTCAHVLSVGGRQTIRIQARHDQKGWWNCSEKPLHIDATDDWAIVSFREEEEGIASAAPLISAAKVPSFPGFDDGAPATGNLFVVAFAGKDPKLRRTPALAASFEPIHGMVDADQEESSIGDARAFRYFVSTEPGTSGAPLVTETGEILGVHGSSEPCREGQETRIGRAVSIHRIMRQLALRGIRTDIDQGGDSPEVDSPEVDQRGWSKRAWGSVKRHKHWVAASLVLVGLGIAAYLLLAKSQADFYKDLLGCWFTQDAREYAEERLQDANERLGQAIDERDLRGRAIASADVIEWNYYAAFSDYMALVDRAAPSRPLKNQGCRELGPPPERGMPVVDSTILDRIQTRLEEIKRVWGQRPMLGSAGDDAAHDALQCAERRMGYVDWLRMLVAVRFGDDSEKSLLDRMHLFPALHPCSKHAQSMSLMIALMALRRGDFQGAYVALETGVRRIGQSISGSCAEVALTSPQEVQAGFGQLTMPELAHCFGKAQVDEAKSVFCAAYMEAKSRAASPHQALEELCAPMGSEIGTPAHLTVLTLLEQLRRRAAHEDWVVECVDPGVVASLPRTLVSDPPATPPAAEEAPAVVPKSPNPGLEEPAGGAGRRNATGAEVRPSDVPSGSVDSVNSKAGTPAGPRPDVGASNKSKCVASALLEPTPAKVDRTMQTLAKLAYDGVAMDSPSYPVPEGRTITTSVHVEGDVLVLVVRVRLGEKVESSTIYAVSCASVESKWSAFSQHEVAQFKGDVSPVVLMPSRYRLACVWLFMIGDDGTGAPRIQVADLRISGKKLSRKSIETTNVDLKSSPKVGLPTLEKFRSKNGSRVVFSIGVVYDEGRKEMWREFMRADKDMKFWRATDEKSTRVDEYWPGDSDVDVLASVTTASAIPEVRTNVRTWAGVARRLGGLPLNAELVDAGRPAQSDQLAWRVFPLFRFFSELSEDQESMPIYTTVDSVNRSSLFASKAPDQRILCPDSLVMVTDLGTVAQVYCPVSGKSRFVGIIADDDRAMEMVPP